MHAQFQLSLGYLRNTGTPKGIGVFASRDIEPEEIVEIAPIILLKTEFEDLEIDLKRRVFNWEHLASMPGISAISLGYGSIYNHDNPANMRYRSVADGSAIAFLAARAVGRDEELTINYNWTRGEPQSDEDTWFKTCGVIPMTGNESEKDVKALT